MSKRFAGKVAFITGAARGQGRAHAVRLASEGADIIAIDSCADVASAGYPGATVEDLAETVKLVEKQGRRIVAHQTDVRDFAALQGVLQAAVSELGRLNVVIANAGICTVGRFWEISADQWRDTIDTNLTGVFHTAKAAAPIMIEQATGGSMVFVSSVAGLKGSPFLAAYVASKHGVTGLTRALANELSIYDIRVNSIHPAGVSAGMQAPGMQELLDDAATTLAPLYMTSLPYTGLQVEDVAYAVAWLTSDEAKYITGIQLPIDLGMNAR